MNTPFVSFEGKDLPTSVWTSKVLHLPEPLAAAHKDFLNDKGWMTAYQPVLSGGSGGKSAEEAQDHVINRFLNSAARMQFVCADPCDEQPEIREMVLDQLGDGHILLLDLAAGNGAGTLAMLSSEKGGEPTRDQTQIVQIEGAFEFPGKLQRFDGFVY